MTGSKRGIEKLLFELFYDEDGKEYTSTSFSRDFLLNMVAKTYPTVNWEKDVYLIIRKWQKGHDEYYNSIYNEDKILVEAGVTDTREICERKYLNGLSLLASERRVPLYYDRDIKEWRAAKALSIYEEIIGDKILQHHNLRNRNLKKLAKRGGRLLSGTEARQIIFDLIDESKKLENKSE